MKQIFYFINGIYLVLKEQYKRVYQELIVKTDDEELALLLRTPEDKYRFQEAISHISEGETKEVVLNGKKVKIYC